MSPSFMSTLSVISISSAAGSSPVSSRIRATSAGKPDWANCCTDTFTATRGTGTPSSRQVLAWAQAVRSTHSPMGTIRLVSSATGMNSAGDTDPNSALVQRSRASTPEMAPLVTSIWGW